MELEIRRVARISGIMLPHAGSGLEVTAENRHRQRGVHTVPVYPVRTIRGVTLIVRGTVLELTRIHEKVANATRREEVINTLSLSGMESVYPLQRRRPVRGGPIGALGQPKTLWPGAEMAPITGSAKLYLRPHTRVKAEQGQIGMGRGRGQNLH